MILNFELCTVQIQPMINVYFKSISKQTRYTPEPQTTKMNRPRSHGPTGNLSSSCFCRPPQHKLNDNNNNNNRVCRSEHITPVHEDLHWLPVSQKVVFKTALMVWKCFRGIAPAYLGDLCIPATDISNRQHLRSAVTVTLLVPHAQTATEQQSFAVNGPSTWNRLPPALWSLDLSESAFKRALKLHLFSTAQRH